MLKIIKVTGESLSPFFFPGDYVLVIKRSLIYPKYNSGDIVVFSHPDLGLLIKEIYQIDPHHQTIYVQGTHPMSINSDTIGPVPFDSVIGKVIWHIKSPRSKISTSQPG